MASGKNRPELRHAADVFSGSAIVKRLRYKLKRRWSDGTTHVICVICVYQIFILSLNPA
jgi:hypothetical protein